MSCPTRTVVSSVSNVTCSGTTPYRAKNPAAFVVKEIQEGGYPPPAELAANQKRNEAQARKQADKTAEEQRRDEEEQRFRARLQAENAALRAKIEKVEYL